MALYKRFRSYVTEGIKLPPMGQVGLSGDVYQTYILINAGKLGYTYAANNISDVGFISYTDISLSAIQNSIFNTIGNIIVDISPLKKQWNDEDGNITDNNREIKLLDNRIDVSGAIFNIVYNDGAGNLSTFPVNIDTNNGGYASLLDYCFNGVVASINGNVGNNYVIATSLLPAGFDNIQVYAGEGFYAGGDYYTITQDVLVSTTGTQVYVTNSKGNINYPKPILGTFSNAIVNINAPIYEIYFVKYPTQYIDSNTHNVFYQLTPFNYQLDSSASALEIYYSGDIIIDNITSEHINIQNPHTLTEKQQKIYTLVATPSSNRLKSVTINDLLYDIDYGIMTNAAALTASNDLIAAPFNVGFLNSDKLFTRLGQLVQPDYAGTDAINLFERDISPTPAPSKSYEFKSFYVNPNLIYPLADYSLAQSTTQWSLYPYRAGSPSGSLSAAIKIGTYGGSLSSLTAIPSFGSKLPTDALSSGYFYFAPGMHGIKLSTLIDRAAKIAFKGTISTSATVASFDNSSFSGAFDYYLQTWNSSNSSSTARASFDGLALQKKNYDRSKPTYDITINTSGHSFAVGDTVRFVNVSGFNQYYQGDTNGGLALSGRLWIVSSISGNTFDIRYQPKFSGDIKFLEFYASESTFYGSQSAPAYIQKEYYEGIDGLEINQSPPHKFIADDLYVNFQLLFGINPIFGIQVEYDENPGGKQPDAWPCSFKLNTPLNELIKQILYITGTQLRVSTALDGSQVIHLDERTNGILGLPSIWNNKVNESSQQLKKIGKEAIKISNKTDSSISYSPKKSDDSINFETIWKAKERSFIDYPNNCIYDTNKSINQQYWGFHLEQSDGQNYIWNNYLGWLVGQYLFVYDSISTATKRFPDDYYIYQFDYISGNQLIPYSIEAPHIYGSFNSVEYITHRNRIPTKTENRFNTLQTLNEFWTSQLLGRKTVIQRKYSAISDINGNISTIRPGLTGSWLWNGVQKTFKAIEVEQDEFNNQTTIIWEEVYNQNNAFFPQVIIDNNNTNTKTGGNISLAGGNGQSSTVSQKTITKIGDYNADVRELKFYSSVSGGVSQVLRTYNATVFSMNNIPQYAWITISGKTFSDVNAQLFFNPAKYNNEVGNVEIVGVSNPGQPNFFVSGICSFAEGEDMGAVPSNRYYLNKPFYWDEDVGMFRFQRYTEHSAYNERSYLHGRIKVETDGVGGLSGSWQTLTSPLKPMSDKEITTYVGSESDSYTGSLSSYPQTEGTNYKQPYTNPGGYMPVIGFGATLNGSTRVVINFGPNMKPMAMTSQSYYYGYTDPWYRYVFTNLIDIGMANGVPNVNSIDIDLQLFDFNKVIAAPPPPNNLVFNRDFIFDPGVMDINSALYIDVWGLVEIVGQNASTF